MIHVLAWFSEFTHVTVNDWQTEEFPKFYVDPPFISKEIRLLIL